MCHGKNIIQALLGNLGRCMIYIAPVSCHLPTTYFIEVLDFVHGFCVRYYYLDRLIKSDAWLFLSVSLFFQTGLFKLSDEEFFIQPLEKSGDEASAPQAHAIYKRHTSPPVHRPAIQAVSGKPGLNGTCGNQSKSWLTPDYMHDFYFIVFKFDPFELARWI